MWTSIYEEHKGERVTRNPITTRELRRAESFWGTTFTSEMVELYTFSNGLFGNSQFYFIPDGLWFPTAEYATTHVGDLDFEELIGLDIDFFNSNPGATDRSVPIMFGSYVLGVVCSGPGMGAVWHWGGESFVWVSRSLEEMVGYAIDFHERGWVDWSVGSAPRLNRGAISCGVPGRAFDPPWTDHWGDWRWENVK